jgi:putative hydrolase of HD superfamily
MSVCILCFMKLKGPQLQQFISDNKLFSFFTDLYQLKNLYRQGWLRDGIPEERCESVADHVFGVAMLSWMVAEEYFPELEQEKILKLALIHELGEIFAGDITPVDGVSAEKKYALEWDAVQRVLKDFPESYKDLWLEFEAGSSAEARLVKQMDRLEMAFQASVYERIFGLDLDVYYESAFKTIDMEELVLLVKGCRM